MDQFKNSVSEIHGVTILLGSDGQAVAVRDPADLMARLAASASAQRAYARRWVAYAYDRPEIAADACTVDALSAAIAAGGYRVLDLLVDLTQTDAFNLRAREAMP